jgi:DNA-binding NarL/FixJ family response regulator
MASTTATVIIRQGGIGGGVRGILARPPAVHRGRSFSPSGQGMPIRLYGAPVGVLSTMPAHSPITVAISRFPDLLALGLQTALEADPSVSIVARNVAPARIGTMLSADRPCVFVLDVGALRDFAQVREITLEHPDTYLVLLMHGLSSVDSAQLLAFGASVCLTMDIQLRDLRHAIHLASRGLQLQLLPTSPESQTNEPLLTPREGEVLALLRQNKTNAQIALTLGIGVETVRSHARQIYRKLGVTSRRTLLARAEAPAPASPPHGPAMYVPPRRASSSLVGRRPQHH